MSERNDFNFRRLYESSQASLTDMAARQAEALSRLGRFRNAITLILKRNYPEMFAKAENATGTRLGESDDEIIIAYLETFISNSRSNKKEQSLQPLKEALSSLGLNLQGDDVLGWVDYIHKLRMNGGKVILPSHESILSKETQAKPQDDNISISIENIFEDEISPPEQQKVETDHTSLENIFQDTTPKIIIDSENASENISAVAGRWSPSPVSGISLPTQSPRDSETPKDCEELLTKDSPSETEQILEQNLENVFHQPLRPQLFPSAPKGKRKSRYLKVQADRPEDLTYDSPNTKPVLATAFTSELSSKILTSCAISRPVFIRDLVSVGGSREIIEHWENECRSNPAKNPVRFIGAKLRHRDRGSLVIPATSLRIVNKEQSKNWWWEAIESYRGAKLYELGVLLGVRIGDSLVSTKFTDNYAVLRVNANTGLAAFIVLFASKVDEEGPTNAAFISELAELGKERLSQIIVLTTISEDKSLDRTISAIDNFVKKTKWSPNCPVSVSYSWEFADNRGSSAHLVVTQSS